MFYCNNIDQHVVNVANEIAAEVNLTAWDLIGYEGESWVQVVGGRAKYDTVMYHDDTPGTQVILGRLNADLSQTLRYVDPDTPMRFVA